MSQCLVKLPHSCGTRSGLQVFENEDKSLTGFCFSCKIFVADPMGEGKTSDDIPVAQRIRKTLEEIQVEIEEINGYQTIDIRSRKLRKDVLEHFGVKVGVSEQDGKTPTFQYFPYYKDNELLGYKVKLLQQKKFWAVGDIREADLFGWKQAIQSGSKSLIIVEGENDAVALTRILQMHTPEEYKHAIPAVVSLRSGVSSATKDLAKKWPKIKRHFKEIALCFDNDEPGQLATEEVCKRFPEVKTIILPEKDANECLIKGCTKAAYQAAKWNSAKASNSRLVWLDDVWEKAKEPAKFGVSWPWEELTELTRGIRTGETIYFGAAQKIGKSELLNQIAAHLVAVHDWKVMLVKPEEANVKTAKLLANKIAKAKFHDPKIPFDEVKYEKAGKILLGKKVCMVNLYQHLGWDSLKDDIRVAAADGVKAVFIDPITNLTNGMNAADANTKLQEVAQELAAMAKDLDIVIFIFCHLRNPDGGLPHDRGGAVLTSQFAGSRAMGRSCNYMFGIEGNKDPELSEEERNVRTVVLLDDREYGEVGRVSLFWDKNTTMFNEM